MNRSDTDKWANFLANEKLVPRSMDPVWVLRLIALCERMALVRPPAISPYKAKLEAREFVCLTAMEMGLDLTAVRHRATGKVLMARSLLDAWNKAYHKKFGGTAGTAGVAEATRRNIVTKLCKERED